LLPAFRHQPEVFALRMQPDLAAVDRVGAFGAIMCITLRALGPLPPRRGISIRYTVTFIVFQRLMLISIRYSHLVCNGSFFV
jgi:hypothetical protein